MTSAGGGELDGTRTEEPTYHAFSAPQKKCQKPLGYLYRRKIHRLASTSGRLSSAMRAGLQAYQLEGRPRARACKREGETAQSSTGGRTHRFVTSLQGRGKRANGYGCGSMPTIGGRRVCLTAAGLPKLVKRERRLGLDKDTASTQGWACGRGAVRWRESALRMSCSWVQ